MSDTIGIHAGSINAGRRPSPAIPLNVLSPNPRRAPTLYDDAHGPSSYAHDNEYQDFRRIRILPTTDEILAVEKPVYVPKKDLQTPNPLPPGPQRLVDMLFRQLRFDGLEAVRDICYSAAQICFLSSDLDSTLTTSFSSDIDTDIQIKQETLAGNRYFLYKNVKIEELVPHEQASALARVSYDCPKFMRGRWLHQTGRFQEGMLVAILALNTNTNRLDISFLEIHCAQSTDSMKPRNGHGHRAAILASLLLDASEAEVRHFAALAEGTSPFISLSMVEFPRLLYAGIHTCLSRLQEMDDFAFDKYISPCWNAFKINANVGQFARFGFREKVPSVAPSYVTEENFTYNLKPVALQPHGDLLEAVTPAALHADTRAKDLHSMTIFDSGQAAALRHCLLNEFALVQGPPGTGKTFLGIHLTRVLLASRPSRGPILVVCLTNHALDSFLGGLKAAGVEKLLRLGGGSKEEWTETINLRHVNRKQRFSENESRKKQSLKHELQEAFCNINEWCESQSARTLTGRSSWSSVRDIIARDNPTVYQQFKDVAHAAYLQTHFYDFWARGGDVSKIASLKDNLASTHTTKVLDPDATSDVESQKFQDLCALVERQHVGFGANSIWAIPPNKRKEMVVQWDNKIDLESLLYSFADPFSEHRQKLKEIKKINDARNLRVMQSYDVIGVTTTGCASRWDFLSQLDIEIVICEEAGEVMEAHALCALLPTVNHAIFIGDPLQLRPETQQRSMSLECTVDYRLDESMFERLMMPQDAAAHALPAERLTIQRRMHPNIADITRITYGYLRDDPSTASHPPTAGIQQRVFWWHHRVPELGETGVTKSHVNPHEVEMVHGLVDYLLRINAYSPGDIAVLTPYSGQLAALHQSLKTTCKIWLNEKDRELLFKHDLLDTNKLAIPEKDELPLSQLLRVTTVDNFQGEEAKVVILSTVRSGGSPGFLAIPNRVNVACSRARDGFYIVGNSATLRQVPLWESILTKLKGRIGTKLNLHCDRHPNHQAAIEHPAEFAEVEVCSLICSAELRCGHVCNQKCHPLSLHENGAMPCLQQCKKKLVCSHRCLRECSVDCGPCLVSTGETTLDCGHSGFDLCSGDNSKCTVNVGHKTLKCGHVIEVICGEDGDNKIGCRVCEEMKKEKTIASQLTNLIDFNTTDEAMIKINAMTKSFASAIKAVSNELEKTFLSFCTSMTLGILAWDANRGLIVRRVEEVRDLRARITEYIKKVVLPFETGSVEDYTFLLSLRLKAFEYRTTSILLLEYVRIAKHLLKAPDPTGQTQRIGSTICTVAQGEALIHFKDHLPKILSQTNKDRLETCPSLDLEFRLTKVLLWLIAYDALTASNATSKALDHQAISCFLTSLDEVIETSKRFSTQCKSFHDTAIIYKTILEAIVSGGTNSPAICNVDVASVLSMEKNLGTSTLDKYNFVTCDNKHPYDLSVFLAQCPECGKRVETKHEVLKAMEKHLQNDKFLESMKSLSASSPPSPKLDKDTKFEPDAASQSASEVAAPEIPPNGDEPKPLTETNLEGETQDQETTASGDPTTDVETSADQMDLALGPQRVASDEQRFMDGPRRNYSNPEPAGNNNSSSPPHVPTETTASPDAVSVIDVVQFHDQEDQATGIHRDWVLVTAAFSNADDTVSSSILSMSPTSTDSLRLAEQQVGEGVGNDGSMSGVDNTEHVEEAQHAEEAGASVPVVCRTPQPGAEQADGVVKTIIEPEPEVTNEHKFLVAMRQISASGSMRSEVKARVVKPLCSV